MLLLKYFLLGTDLTHGTIYMVTLKQSCQICGAVKKINFSFTVEFWDVQEVKKMQLSPESF